ncbi:hypothetical protein ABZX85_24240 [Streptomyces sp. NPDC004539]|uniref:hypothetical protein n=1 Tax=Streptomyces sp. NPDC004539 TaxID=3154280 RepID=UPI0033AEFF1A
MTRPYPSRKAAAALTALAATGVTLLGASAAVAAPGDNGDVKIHTVGTAVDAQANQPKVCRFYLDAFNFDTAQGIDWTIQPQGGNSGTTATLSDSLTLANGTGTTENLLLPTGQYKLTWKIVGGNGAGKMKVFKVDCPDITPSSPPPTGGPGGPGGGPGGPGGGPGGPNGGPPAGGGGLAKDDAFSPLAGAAAVGVTAVGAVAWFRLRRRPHGAA